MGEHKSAARRRASTSAARAAARRTRSADGATGCVLALEGELDLAAAPRCASASTSSTASRWCSTSRA